VTTAARSAARSSPLPFFTPPFFLIDVFSSPAMRGEH
jgi:hypothetical protein